MKTCCIWLEVEVNRPLGTVEEDNNFTKETEESKKVEVDDKETQLKHTTFCQRLIASTFS